MKLGNALLNPLRAFRHIYLVECPERRHYSVHKRHPVHRTFILGFTEKECAERFAASLERYESTHGTYPQLPIYDSVNVKLPFDIAPLTELKNLRVRPAYLSSMLDTMRPTGVGMYVCLSINKRTLRCVRCSTSGNIKMVRDYLEKLVHNSGMPSWLAFLLAIIPPNTRD